MAALPSGLGLHIWEAGRIGFDQTSKTNGSGSGAEPRFANDHLLWRPDRIHDLVTEQVEVENPSHHPPRRSGRVSERFFPDRISAAGRDMGRGSTAPTD